jgi:enterochelin esterase-like enzyme
MKFLKDPTAVTLTMIAGVLAVWLIYLCIIPKAFDENWVKSGLFGDSFGALNTLFTGLAFAVVLGSLRAQSKEIDRNADELAMLAEGVRLQALQARIAHYGEQIAHAVGVTQSNLEKERKTLVEELDAVIQHFREMPRPSGK